MNANAALVSHSRPLLVPILVLLVACGEGADGMQAPVQAGAAAPKAGAPSVPMPAAGSGNTPPSGPPAAGAAAAGAPAAGAAGGAGGMSGAGGGAHASAAGTAGAAGAAGGGPGSAEPDPSLIAALEAYLAMPRAQRPALETQSFATAPLSRAQAEQARTLLWDDFAAEIRESRAGEMGATASRAASLSVGGSTLRYFAAQRGEPDKAGRSLFISMHGGGNAPAATNDQQWNNQIALVEQYRPEDAIWVAPRAPSNEWNIPVVR